MAEYTEIKYVDANYGSDELGDGSEDKPYQTIQFCKSQLTTANPLVYIADGEYELDNIIQLQKQNVTITYIGNGMSTVLNVDQTVDHKYSKSNII